MKSDRPENDHPKTVKITINGTVYDVRPGNHPVTQLKTLPNPNIRPDETLCMVVGTEIRPLGNHDHIDIKGGESFASNCQTGGAS